MSAGGERDLRAIGDLARGEIRGDVPAQEHDRGRERALAAFARHGGKGRPGKGRVVGVWLAAAAIVCAIGVALAAWPKAPLRFTVNGVVATAGSYVHARQGGAGAPVRFSDGSEVVFAPGGSGRVAEVGPRGARVQIETGRATVRVAHLPAARWSIEAGPFAVAVIGTRFDVAWSPEAQALEVALHEGAVAVRGPLAPGGIEMRAGQRLVARVAEGEIHIDEGGPRAAASAPPASPSAAAEAPSAVAEAPASAGIPAGPGMAASAGLPASAGAPASAAPPSPPRAGRWPERVASGDFRGVLADAEARGLDRAIKLAPLADLVALADAARYAGRADVARRALVAERERFGGTAEARAAAFLLGRMADDGGGAPGEAIRWYDAYLAEAPRGAFAAEALGRRMMALRRAGDAGARAAAEAYLRLHPSGAHAAAAREIAAP